MEMINKKLENTKKLINRLTRDGKKPYTCAVFTDAHLCAADEPQFLALLDAAKAADEAIGLDSIISLGDNLGMLGRQRHASNDEIAEILGEIFASCAKSVKKSGAPVFAINGNHDAVGTDFFKVELWNRAVSTVGHETETHDGDSAYYFVDDTAAKLRLIFLSTPYGSDLEAEMPTPLWAFGDAQLDWLEKVALDLPDGFDVILFSHVPANSVYHGDFEKTLDVWAGDRAAKSRIADLCGWLDDRSRFAAVVNAFAECGRGRVLAAISGHDHSDMSFLPGDRCDGEPNELPCKQINLAAASVKCNPRLRANAVCGFSLDLLIVGEDELHFVRLGDGDDRVFTI